MMKGGGGDGCTYIAVTGALFFFFGLLEFVWVKVMNKMVMIYTGTAEGVPQIV